MKQQCALRTLQFALWTLAMLCVAGCAGRELHPSALETGQQLREAGEWISEKGNRHTFSAEVVGDIEEWIFTRDESEYLIRRTLTFTSGDVYEGDEAVPVVWGIGLKTIYLEVMSANGAEALADGDVNLARSIAIDACRFPDQESASFENANAINEEGGYYRFRTTVFEAGCTANTQ